jgi:hypothetical protein
VHVGVGPLHRRRRRRLHARVAAALGGRSWMSLAPELRRHVETEVSLRPVERPGGHAALSS